MYPKSSQEISAQARRKGQACFIFQIVMICFLAQLKMSALEDELDKRATEAEGGISHFNFSHPAVQSRPLSPLSQAVLMNQLPMVRPCLLSLHAT